MAFLRILLLLASCLPLAAWPAQQYAVRISDQKPQTRENFVQGLEIRDGYLYVSAGLYGESRLLRYHFRDGHLDRGQALPGGIFAEGLTVFGDYVYQLTWRNQTMLVYRKADLQFLHALPVPGEGWGLTHNGAELIYSDGSDKLYFIAPDTAQVLRTLHVTERGRPLPLLNELEWVDGAIWANVFQSDRIVIIDAASGEVTASIDLRGLLPPAEYRPETDVLNGIARDPADGGIWVTGKRWPWMYRIELVPLSDEPETQQSRLISR